MLLQFQSEREKRYFGLRRRCPYCIKEDKYCPPWIANEWPLAGEFEKWSFEKKREWLKHTRHLI